MPATADEGAPLLPNIRDPTAIDAQTVCPGYKASQVKTNDRGLEAVLTLAGEPCNVYGNDVEVLRFVVEEQGKKRMAVRVEPAWIVSDFSFYGVMG